jgi:hypothetical protein
MPLSLAALACIVTAILMRPIAGIYLMVFFSVVGDAVTMTGYPFTLNFSSPQSFLYLADGLTFTPLELCIAVTAASWFAQVVGGRSWQLSGRPLLAPVLIFGAFVVAGAVYGVYVQRGDRIIAVWELRPLLYVVAIYVLSSNLFTRTSHYVTLAWVAVVAISIQNLFALRYYYTLAGSERELLQSLTEHPTSLIYNWVILLALALCVLRGCSLLARLGVVAAAIPAAHVWVLAQRRAAVVALLVGFILLAIVLFIRRRKACLVLVPVVLVLTAGYTAAFWNTTDGPGFGAQAVKSVVAPDDLSEKDRTSSLYRDVENYNLVFTARAVPLTGVGFGKPFYRPAQLPYIAGFAFNEYIPHNSIVWIWLKMGYFGFVALLFMIAVALRAGLRASLQLDSGDTLAVTLASFIFIAMFAVFAYVDIAWGPITCVFLAVSMATCANIVRLAKAPEARPDNLLDELAAGTDARRPQDHVGRASVP